MENITIIVEVYTIPGTRDKFLQATDVSQSATLQEPGCSRYEILQDIVDENHFTLIETYKDEAAIQSHKQTPHFQRWRNDVQPYMVQNRTSVKYTS
jgi:autoinducer 2-degrading protein